MKKKKAYSMIELIMAVGSLLLVLGVFSVIVKTYLWEFSEGTLGERKWADVQTFFTYVSRDLEELSESLESGETLKINSDGTIELKASDGTVTDSVVYSVDDSTGNISRDGTVIVKVNNSFEIDGLGLKVYENSLDVNSINSNWEYEKLDDPVEISSETTSNYYVEPAITLTDGSKINGGYALRFDNVTESEETVIYEETYTEQGLEDLENNTITIDTASCNGQTKNIILTAEASTGNLNKLESVKYNETTVETSEINDIATYDFGENVLGTEMKFVFEMANNGLTTKEIKITVTLSEP
ncbi:hypothetical protein [uncultured Ilyobacter sp.]|uniref:hypothetical protein n=1 Tax=uncultured Ilyobacter sp. TaxID=544433 RepID=UPI0029F50159|nr:hypothetical protein [uncultured Ilyobacter sp.]